jgi:nitroimidazol reductase NimA-like FMN-containing flavoprotein (pyridoxamine 5'-phosphate oxidase superfamily)
LELGLSKIWKERLLDFIRIVAILLCMHVIWLATSGDTEKYNIPVIIAWEAGMIIFFWILYGEAMRTADYKIEELEDKYHEIKNR